MKHIYFISGLGADAGMFRFLKLSGNIQSYFIDWLSPFPDESFVAYASRLREVIKEKNPILIGLSFGGLVAIEIASQMPVEKVILISSLRARKELPILYKLAAFIRLQKLIPTAFYKQANGITYSFFGVKEKNDKVVLKRILAETDTNFLRWAIDKVLTWRSKGYPVNSIHIHGSKDKIIPLRYVHPDYVVKDGGHLMILNKAREISDVINSELKNFIQNTGS